MITAGAGRVQPALGEQPGLRPVPVPPQHAMPAPREAKAAERAADFALRIAPMLVELAPQVVVSTIGYSNQVPGPLLRMRSSGEFWGVMGLTLLPNGYAWDYESALKDPAQTTGPATFSDKGVGACHGPDPRW